MSAYTDAVNSVFPGAEPVHHYSLNDFAGSSTYNNTGSGAVDVTTNGSVTEGSQSILPGDPSNSCCFQTQDVYMAGRGDNGVLDRPTTALTVCCWVRPDSQRDSMPLIFKGNQYNIQIRDSLVRAAITGQPNSGNLDTGSDLIVPGNVYFIGTVFNATAQTWKIYVNGVVVMNQGLASGQSVPSASAGNFRLGGQDVLGADGLNGALQHCTVGNAALTDAGMQTLYSVGAASAADLLGIGKTVFPFPTVISSANPSGAPRRVTNSADITLYVAEDPSTTPTAVVGGGWRVPPFGGSQVISSAAQLSAVHEGMGAK